MSTELLPNIRSRFCDGNNVPLAGGKLYTYEAGTATPLATYTDQAAMTPNANPIILDGNGEAVIFITSGVQYKFRLTDANGVDIYTQDNVSGVGFSGNLGTGDTVGPASAVNNQIALFSGTTGKVIKAAIGSGFVKATLGVISFVTGIDLTSDVTGTLPINKGGTGQTSASSALNALLPAQTGNAGKFLKSDGTNAGWVPAPIPAGGAAGYVLQKVDGTDYNTAWAHGAYTASPTIVQNRATPYDVIYNIGIPSPGSDFYTLAFIQGSGGPVTVTANPQIGVGINVGQRLVLILRNSAKPVTFSDGNGLSLKGGPLVMDVLDQTAEFIWDGVNWVYLP